MKKFWEDYFDINSVISEQETIVGILIPIKWSHNGAVEMFAIYSEEHDVIIEEYRSKRRLEKLLNKRVIGKGFLRVDSNDEKFIRLKSIKELPDSFSPSVRLLKPFEQTPLSEEYSLNIPREYALFQYNKHSKDLWRDAS